MASNSPADEILAQYGAPTTDSAPASPAMTPADEVFAQYGEPKNPGGLGKQPDLWGKWTSLANGVVLGAGTRIKAAGAAAGEAVKNLEHGGSWSQVIPDLQNYYGQAKDIYGAARQQYNTAHPIAGPTLEAVGSIPTTLAAMSMGGAGLSALGSTVADAAPMLGDVGNALARYGSAADAYMQNNLLTRATTSAVKAIPLGATATGITSELNDGSLPDQIKGSVVPSAVFGAAAPVVDATANAIGSGVKSIINPLIDRFGNQAPVAANKLMQALSRDGLDPSKIQSILATLGPDAVVADAGGANTQGLARAVAGIPGEGKDLAASTLAGRQDGQSGRVLQAVSDFLSPSSDVHGAIDNLVGARKAAAAPLYDKAYSAPALNPDLIEHGGALDQMMSRPAMQKAAAGALNLAQEEGRDPASLGITVDAQGNAMFEKVPSWQTLDYVKRGLDDVLGKYRDPTTGKLNLDNAGRSVNQTLHDFTDLVDKQNPAYAQARAAYAGPSQTIDAINMGSRFVRNDPEVTAKVMSSMSDQDKQAFRIGVARELQDAIHKAPDGADVVKRIFNNQDKRNKLAAVFPSNQAFQDFTAAMQRESTLYRNSANILQGSRTAPMAAEMQDSGINPGHIFTGVKAVSGNYAGAASDVLRGIVNKLMPMPEDRASELAKLLFSKDASALGQNVNNRAAPSFFGNAIQGASDPRYVIPAAVIGTNRLMSAGRASPP